jgi:serine/threonine protein phosphatase PrpC
MIRAGVLLGGKSIPGHRHVVEGRDNEDAFLTLQEHPYLDALMVISDGMGGHAEPRRASQTAVRAVRDYLIHPDHLAGLRDGRIDVPFLLSQAVEQANRQVRRLSARVPAGHGAERTPGCTLTVAAIAAGRLAVAHVGDGSVFLLRDGTLRTLAGGESRRFGSRPEEYLGRDEQVEIESASEPVHPGDRLLLCTDGLTRYLGHAASAERAGSPGAASTPAGGGLARLQEVVSRFSADPQALASQLTADARGEQYEDDTTVIVAEVQALREVPAPPPPGSDAARPATGADVRDRDTGSRSASRVGVWLAAVGFCLLALAMVLWGWRSWQRTTASEPSKQFPAAAVDLSGLPAGGVLLVDPENGRFFVLRTRPVGVPGGDEPLTLREVRYKPGKGVQDTGKSYRLETGRGRLTAPNGRGYPVLVDDATGVIEIQQAGTLRLETQPPGLPARIDGQNAGPTPVVAHVRAGRHRVQVMLQSTSGPVAVVDEQIEIAPRATITANWVVPVRAAGRGRR